MLPNFTTKNEEEVDYALPTTVLSETRQISTGAIPKHAKAIPITESQIKTKPASPPAPIPSNKSVLPDEAATIDPALKDLLIRLLERNPQYRLKSVLALERIALYKNYKIEDVRNRKTSLKALIGVNRLPTPSHQSTLSHQSTSSANKNDCGDKNNHSNVIKCNSDDDKAVDNCFKEF